MWYRTAESSILLKVSENNSTAILIQFENGYKKNILQQRKIINYR